MYMLFEDIHDACCKFGLPSDENRTFQVANKEERTPEKKEIEKRRKGEKTVEKQDMWKRKTDMYIYVLK